MTAANPKLLARDLLPADAPVRLLGVFAALVAFCETLAFYAAGLVAFDGAGSAGAVAAVMATVCVAEMAGALIGGALADRVDRKRIALGASVSTAALLAALLYGSSLVVVTALLAISVLAASPVRPVIGAALPNLVVDGDLGWANGYVQGLRNLAFTLAPLVAGIGASVIGAQGLFGVAAVGMLLAALVLAGTRGTFQEERAAGDAGDGGILEGVRVIRNDRALAVVVVVGGLMTLVSGVCVVADLPLAIDELGIGEGGYGVLVATWGGGMVLGSMLAGVAIRRLGALRGFVAAAACEGAMLLAVSVLPGASLIGAVFVVGGVFGGIAYVADQLLVQERTVDAVRARVRAANDALLAAAYAASLAVGGIAVELLGPRGTYMVAGIGVTAIATAALLWLRRVEVPAPALAG